MFLHARVHKLLYPLIALLLLMQSFAVWHGAEHSFHIEDEQCERFEAFSQAPTLDNIFTISPFYTSSFLPLDQPLSTIEVPACTCKLDKPIFTPPSFPLLVLFLRPFGYTVTIPFESATLTRS